MISLLASLVLGTGIKTPIYEVRLTPQVRLVPALASQKPKLALALASLPKEGPDLSEICIGDRKTGYFAPSTAGVDIRGFDRNGNPFLTVVSASSKSGYGSRSLLPKGKGFTVPNFAQFDAIDITDVNSQGHVAILCKAYGPKNSRNKKIVKEEAKVFRNGKWTDIANAYDLKINDKGDIAGLIQKVGGRPNELVGFVLRNGKRSLVGTGNRVLLAESGDILVLETRADLIERPGVEAIEKIRNATYYSKGKTETLHFKLGYVPVAIWSKDRYIAHDKEGSEDHFLVENGKYTPLHKLANLPEGYHIASVQRVYANGSIWATLSDSEGTSYEAFLKPKK